MAQQLLYTQDAQENQNANDIFDSGGGHRHCNSVSIYKTVAIVGKYGRGMPELRIGHAGLETRRKEGRQVRSIPSINQT